MKKISILIIVMGLAVSSTLFAQLLGPVLPICTDCTNNTQRVTPFNGLWYNPEQPGVGMSIEVRKTTLFGVYYGYDEAGESTWFTFVGELEKGQNLEPMWSFDAPLKHFVDGTCVNCDYQSPTGSDTNQVIHLNINHKNHISFSINDGDVQNIVPLDFARPLTTAFPDITSFQFPDLTNVWVFVYNLNISPDSSDYFGYQQMITSTQAFVSDNPDGTKKVEYLLFHIIPGETQPMGDITCQTTLDAQGDIVGPACKFTHILFNSPITQPEIFNFPISGLGVNRLFGESEAGHTFEAFRVTLNEDFK